MNGIQHKITFPITSTTSRARVPRTYSSILSGLVVLNGSHLLSITNSRENICAMRNLELLRSFPLLELDGTEEPFCLTVDCDCGIVYTATATRITGFQPSNQEVSCICAPDMQGSLATPTSSKFHWRG